ncbi:MAG TPA: DUF948 domain-containing protein [Gemmatimonadaceae bacterium]|jgi:uncharacterized protein YoxC
MLGLALAHLEASMTTLLAPVAALLHQTAAALHDPAVRDTVLMKQVPADRSWIDRVTEVASALIAIALLTLTVIAVPVAFHSRRTYKRVAELLDRIHGDLAPIMKHAHTISDNVNYVTTSVRAEIHKVNTTIDEANERVQEALAATEQRMSELNALLAVVQQEAEHLFVSTASTVRGVREGAAAFRDRNGMDLASDELDAADDLDSADDIEFQEEVDGYDRKSQSAAEALPAAPRVRPRQRSERRA